MIPHKIAKNLRRFENSLLNLEESHSNRVKGFYLAVRPLLKWIKPYLIVTGLNKHEAESELYIMAADLLDRYNSEKSSLVPYVQAQIVWCIKKHLKRIEKYTDFDYVELENYDTIYKLGDEIYLGNLAILFEEKYLGKTLTRTEKFIISKILESDDENLSQERLASILDIDRKTLKEKLLEIADKLESGGFHE